MDNSDLLSLIKEQLSHPLPGIESQLRMSPKHRAEELKDAQSKISNAKRSGVMLLLYNANDDVKLVCIRRSDYVGIHAGQMGLPGGRYEELDRNTLQTALRETEEEIGVSGNNIEIAGRLSGLYIPPSNFYVDPYVGFLKQKPVYHIDVREVKAVEEISLNELLKESAVKTKEFKTHGKESKTQAPYYEIGNVEIWGATAMILSEFLEIVKRATNK